MGVGECAGEVVSPIDFELDACEREAFEAQLQLEAGDIDEAARMAYESMLHAAVGAAEIAACRGRRTIPTGSWTSSASSSTTRSSSSIPSRAASSRSISSRRTSAAARSYNAESAHQLIEEAQLFIEAAHSCYARMLAQPAAVYRVAAMNPIQHIRVKIFAREPVSVDLGDAIPVFHRWIQDRVCPEMLIDVADYRHVPAGPGVLLIGHEANYSLDLAKNRLGLLYSRKQAGGDAQENLRQAFDAARGRLPAPRTGAGFCRQTAIRFARLRVFHQRSPACAQSPTRPIARSEA